jgi:hypothetical protein
MFSSVGSSLAAEKWADLVVIGGFRYFFTLSQATFFMQLQGQNRRFRVFEEGY